VRPAGRDTIKWPLFNFSNMSKGFTSERKMEAAFSEAQADLRSMACKFAHKSEGWQSMHTMELAALGQRVMELKDIYENWPRDQIEKE